MHEICQNTILAKTFKIVVLLRENHYFPEIEKRKKEKIEHKSMKNGMFLGTSFLSAFWRGFGRVLGGQNPRFSHFFRCFFEVNFKARSGRAKNRPKRPTRRRWWNFGSGFRWSPGSWGEKKRGVAELSDRSSKKTVEIDLWRPNYSNKLMTDSARPTPLRGAAD